MHKSLKMATIAAFVLAQTACTSHYTLTNINRTRIVVDQRFDSQPDAAAMTYIAPYKHKVDSIMGPVVGRVAHSMSADRPESDLSNLLSDILIWASKDYNEQPDVAIYNVGGIRSAFAKGEVTYGDVLDIAPFENKISFATLSGKDLLLLFSQIAAKGGEGVSHGTNLVISPKGELLSARLNGKEIVPTADYRIVTIDYLMEGNDGMTAFKMCRNQVSPKEKKDNTRNIIVNYFKEKASKNEAVSAKVEGRIVVRQ